MNEYRIERLGHQGDGIADGPVFAARVLPGEIVTGDLDGNRLKSPRIVTPSSDRVAALCPHYKRCGGCALQHASDAFVEAWKTDLVVSALAAHGIDAPIRHYHTSPPNSRRRAVLSGRRTKKGALVGFYAPQSDVLNDIPECKILDPGILSALPYLEQLVTRIGSRKGTLRLGVTLTESGLDIAITGAQEPDNQALPDIAALAEEGSFARISIDGVPLLTRSPPVLKLGTAPVTPPPGAFLQATLAGERALLSAVSDAVGGASRIVDLFSGCGTFALPLATQSEVHAVEAEGEMLEALDAGWRHASGVRQVTTERRDLFRRPMLPDELKRFDAIVIDPPRAGAEAQVEQLAKAQRPIIASVSCNPITFARDTALLVKAGYAIDWIDIVDQFRWAAHVELVANLRLR